MKSKKCLIWVYKHRIYCRHTSTGRIFRQVDNAESVVSVNQSVLQETEETKQSKSSYIEIQGLGYYDKEDFTEQSDAF